jgi:drug/metabolite transporter (DMT)-like permease
MSQSLETPSTEQQARGVAMGHAALVIVQVCFGLFPVFGTLAMRSFEGAVVTAYRVLFASLVLGGIAWWRYGRTMLPAARDLLRLQVCALLGITLNQLIFLEGLRRSTSYNAGLIMGTIPVFTFAIAALVRQERFSLRRGLGTLVALAGVATLFYGKGAELRSEYLTGNLLMVTNALCYAAYIVAAKPLLQRYPPLVVITWIFLLSAWLVPIYGIGQDWTPADTTQEALLSLGYVLIFPTVLAYLLHTFALTHVASTTTAIYIYLQPVIATLAGIWILGEEPGLHVFVAALGIFGGLALVLWKKPRNRSEPRTTP